jgi:DNA-binding beta-propeller fold protein YncE
MSDRREHSDPNQEPAVDPTLDALLRRTLGVGALSPSQRARHLDDLDIAPRLTTSAGGLRTSAMPAGIGWRQTISYGPSQEQEARQGRQWLELAGAVIACVVVAGLLVMLLRGDGNGDAPELAQFLASSELAASPQVTPTSAPVFVTRERLYVVSRVLTQTPGDVLISGRVTAFDGATGEQVWTLHARAAVDALLSHDGTTLYIASLDEHASSDVIALDAVSGVERWRTTVPNRVWWSNGAGPSSLALSADGERLYVSSCVLVEAVSCEPATRKWFQILDSRTGEQLGEVNAPDCLGASYLAPDERTLYVVCEGRGAVQLIDVETGDAESLPITQSKVGSAVSRDGRLLYIVTSSDGVYEAAVVDLNERSITARGSVALVGHQPERFLQLVALSPDGSRLFIGVLSAYAGQESIARDLFVVDSQTLQSLGRVSAALPINAQSLAAANDNRSVFAAHNTVERDPAIWARSTIQRLILDGAAQTFAVLEHQEVLRLLHGTVEVEASP